MRVEARRSWRRRRRPPRRARPARSPRASARRPAARGLTPAAPTAGAAAGSARRARGSSRTPFSTTRTLPGGRPGIVTARSGCDARAPMTLTVSLLGPPRVVRDGAPVSFDTRKATALLAYLALAERAHARDALAELLWPDHDTAHARGRAAPDALDPAPGHRRRAPRDDARPRRAGGRASLDLDVRRFRALTARDAAARELERAVALCGGDLLEGFGAARQPGLRRLAAAAGRRPAPRAGGRRSTGSPTSRRPRATTRRRSATRAAGSTSSRSTSRRRVRLIRLLAAAGDRAGALPEYRTCVRVLSAELGVAPLPSTTALFDAIGEGDEEAAPATARRRRAGAPPVRSGELPLVGREAEWAALLRALRGGRARRPGRPSWRGRPASARRAWPRPSSPARGSAARPRSTARCFEEEAGVAYAPVAQALRGEPGRAGGLARGGPRPRPRRGGAPRPRAGRRAGRAAAAAAPGGPGAEGRFLDGVCEALFAALGGPSPKGGGDGAAGRAARRRPAVGRRGHAPPARLPPAPPGRPPGPRAGDLAPAARRRAAPRRSPTPSARRARRCTRLGRLGPAEVADLVRSAQAPPGTTAAGDGPPPEDLAERLFAETEGVPFLLVEYLAALAAGSEGGPEEGWPLPAGAQALIRGAGRRARGGRAAGARRRRGARADLRRRHAAGDGRAQRRGGGGRPRGARRARPGRRGAGRLRLRPREGARAGLRRHRPGATPAAAPARRRRPREAGPRPRGPLGARRAPPPAGGPRRRGGARLRPRGRPRPRRLRQRRRPRAPARGARPRPPRAPRAADRGRERPDAPGRLRRRRGELRDGGVRGGRGGGRRSGAAPGRGARPARRVGPRRGPPAHRARGDAAGGRGGARGTARRAEPHAPRTRRRERGTRARPARARAGRGGRGRGRRRTGAEHPRRRWRAATGTSTPPAATSSAARRSPPRWGTGPRRRPR